MFEGIPGTTPLDPDEIEGLKFKHVTPRGELDELEQHNIEQGLAWIKRRRRGSIFDDAFIRLLHKKLFGEVWAWADNEVYCPLEVVVRFHHRLVQIHLFPNGNGRHARRDDYLAALRAADQNDLGPLLNFVSVPD